jgi:hypothetical protein
MSTGQRPLESSVGLHLAIEPRWLSARVSNNTLRELKLWDLENSWGWMTFSFKLASRNTPLVLIKRTNREWTRNIPSVVTISPGSLWQTTFDFNDGWWSVPPEVAELRSDVIEVQLFYDVPVTPEAKEHNVETGSVASNIVTSTPPHVLFPAL